MRRKPALNQEHYDRLKQGVDTWNAWRKEHPDIHPDLSSANLRGADLIDAHLSSADLSFADLRVADLNGANLRGADLSDADLLYASLNGADLSGADLSDADLSSADLSSAILSYTMFAYNDLSTVKGLVEIDHRRRSWISLDTVKLPQDGSALHFLRGVGVSDEWIDFYRSTMMHPIQYYSCFISYSSSDEVLARRLHADLQGQGVRCWFAPHDMQPGQLIRESIDRAIHMQDKLLLILSEGSVKSGWVRLEVETALAREARQQREILFPIRIDDAVFQSTANWATSLANQRHIGDFRQWADPKQHQKVFKRLLRDLKAQT